MRSPKLLLGSLLVTAFLGACGKEPSVTIESLLPAENAVSGWTLDSTFPIQPVITTASQLGLSYPTAGGTGGINGSAEPFIDHSFTSFVARYYVNNDYLLKVWLVQLPSAATAKSLYEDVLVPGRYQGSIQASQPWGAANVGIGDAGRIAYTGVISRLNARKGIFYWELELSAKGSADIPDSTKQMVIEFSNAIAAKVK